MKVSDSISSSDSENATHESKQEGNSRKVGGNDKEEALQRVKLMLNQCTCLKRYL